MKKVLALILTTVLLLSALPVCAASAAESGKPTGFTTSEALYVHAVLGSSDGEAWQK